ncbi:M28 family metallopeptidase [Candidatus Lokiarchaeum ossiferum]|uniref:M28 family metallopeptidase n=1 Tax=Candidatus Lokiarchaeum ossiferum TaxID=2951803 RepID=UPI00352CE625
MKGMDFTELAKNSLKNTDELIHEFGPRLAGTKQCQKVGDKLGQILSEFCDESNVEDIEIHPESFSFYIKFLPLMYALGSLFFYLRSNWIIIPLIGMIFGIFMMISIFGFYKHFFDRFFPKKVGKNVYGCIEPTKDVHQQVILSGHHDSAREIRILASRFQKFYAPAIFIPYFFFLYAIIIFIIAISGQFNIVSSTFITICNIISLPFMIVYIFMLSSKGTPGAGDNLIASVMVIELGKKLASLKHSNDLYLNHTRVILASFDAEEAGLRGAAAFMETHYKKLQKIPTYHLNFDSLYNVDQFHILTHDINGTIPLSQEMVDDVIKIASKHGISFSKFSMTFGGGGTDAAESARKGIAATTILAMPTDIVREGLVYHTRNDTVDSIESEVIEGCLKIAWDFLWLKEKQIES